MICDWNLEFTIPIHVLSFPKSVFTLFLKWWRSAKCSQAFYHHTTYPVCIFKNILSVVEDTITKRQERLNTETEGTRTCEKRIVNWTTLWFWLLPPLLPNADTLAIWCEELTHWRRPWCWERLKAGGKGDNRGWDGCMASLTWWIWVWASSRSWWWTEKPGVLQSVGLQRVRHDWATKLTGHY